MPENARRPRVVDVRRPQPDTRAGQRRGPDRVLRHGSILQRCARGAESG
ncbi:MAG: hypothetical protein QOF25_2760 [Mycobacterium sp.]|nr:hypothetical protein [Mycobacterium sp.]